MGTNYYLRTNECECCGRFDSVHIGKSSMGWSFMFHATEAIRSEDDWRKATANGAIFDEYGREVPGEDFWRLVESKRDGRNHAIEVRGEPYYLHVAGRYFLDGKGNSFTEGEFS